MKRFRFLPLLVSKRRQQCRVGSILIVACLLIGWSVGTFRGADRQLKALETDSSLRDYLQEQQVRSRHPGPLASSSSFHTVGPSSSTSSPSSAPRSNAVWSALDFWNVPLPGALEKQPASSPTAQPQAVLLDPAVPAQIFAALAVSPSSSPSSSTSSSSSSSIPSSLSTSGNGSMSSRESQVLSSAVSSQSESVKASWIPEVGFDLPVRPAEPVRIATMTSHFLGEFERRIEDCPDPFLPPYGLEHDREMQAFDHRLDDLVRPLRGRLRRTWATGWPPNGQPSVLESSSSSSSVPMMDCVIEIGQRPNTDAYWYHLPTTSAELVRASLRDAPRPMISIGFSMESAAYYPVVRDEDLVSEMDILMTYRLDSNVISYYWRNHSDIYKAVPHMFPGRAIEPDNTLTPWEDRKNAVVYLNSNCAALSNRDEIVGELMDRGIPVDSYGSCRRNMERSGRIPDKVKLFQKYRFCIVMENSNDRDYVTEKLYDGLEAGCLPIYFGPPNAKFFLPDNKAVILYSPNGDDDDPDSPTTTTALADLIHRLMMDEDAYRTYFEWRGKPVDQLASGWQWLMGLIRRGHSDCQMCRLVALHRRHRQVHGNVTKAS